MKKLVVLAILALGLHGCAFSIGAWVKTGDNVRKIEYTTPAPTDKLPMTGAAAEPTR